jgi:hypothetical protein
MQTKSNCRKKMQKKRITNAQKMQMQKRNAKQIEIKNKEYTASSKT